MSNAFDFVRIKLVKIHCRFMVDRVEINRNLCYNIFMVF